MLSFVGAALILVAAAVGCDAAESDAAPGAQAASASAADVITMASAVGRSLVLERFPMMFMKTPSSLTRS
jgi:hypothetical protein